jgi:RHS repeat-associated protein
MKKPIQRSKMLYRLSFGLIFGLWSTVFPFWKDVELSSQIPEQNVFIQDDSDPLILSYPLVVDVTDDDGTALAGKRVTFSLEKGEGGGLSKVADVDISQDDLDKTIGVTSDAQGQATGYFYAAASKEQQMIVKASSSDKAMTFTINVSDKELRNVSDVSDHLAQPLTEFDQPFAVRLIHTITDQPVVGFPVKFLPIDGGTIKGESHAEVLTNENGEASIRFTPSQNMGLFRVEAWAEGALGKAVFRVDVNEHGDALAGNGKTCGNGGPCTGKTCDTDPECPDPVSASHGQLFHSSPLFELQGNGGLGFEFEFAYNSRSSLEESATPGLSRGWTHSYSWALFAHPEEGYIRVLPWDGAILMFRGENGLYFSPAATYAKITALPDDHYLLQYSDGKKYFFEPAPQLFPEPTPSHRLTKIEDRNGNGIQMEYDEEGYLVGLQDTVGRTAQLRYENEWEGEKLLSSVMDPAGRSNAIQQLPWQGGTILRKISYPGGLFSEYTYAVQMQFDRFPVLTAFEDLHGMPNLKKLEYQYVSFEDSGVRGRVEQERTPLAETAKFSYPLESRTVVSYPASEEDRLQDVVYYDQGFAFDDTVPERPLVGKQDREGNTMLWERDLYDHPTREEDPRGGVRRFAYDLRGNLIASVNQSKGVVRMDYDPYGGITKRVDELKRATIIERDAHGNPTKIINALGDEMVQTFDEHGNLTSVIDFRGLMTTFTIDEFGYRSSIAYPDGETITLDYDLLGRLLSRTDTLNRQTIYSYSEGDNTMLPDLLTGIQYPDGSRVSYEYDSHGNRTKAVDENGNVQAFEYNIEDRVVKMTQYISDVEVAETSYEYDLYTRTRIAVTDPLGATITSRYNPNRNIIESKNAESDVVSYTYDQNGNRDSVTDENNQTTRYEYNERDLLTKVISPLDYVDKEYTYDKVDNVIQTKDGEGHITRYGYDELNRLRTVTDAMGFVTEYEYDDNSNVTVMRDANGHETHFTYDNRNRLTSVTDAEGNETHYTYDTIGRLVQEDTPNGDALVYQYNDRNRLTEVSDGQGLLLRYAYDPKGNLMEMNNEGGKTTFTYDGADRLVSVATPQGKTVRYIYDLSGNRTGMSVDGASPVSYRYDQAHRVKEIEKDGSIAAYTYDHASNRLQMIYPNETIADYVYDAENRLVRLENKTSSGEPISTYAYTYDQVGNRTTMETLNGVDQYAYDRLNRLLGVQYANGDRVGYRYDATGNRLKKVEDGVVTSYSYDDADRLLQEGETTYAYDGNGNRISKISPSESWGYDYDTLDQLREVSKDQQSVAAYTYDGFGRRTSTTANNTTEQYLYDGANVLLDLDENHVVQKNYLTGLGVDELISRFDQDGQVFAYHADGLGSVTGLTDAAQTRVNSYHYDVFGAVRDQAGSVENRYLFTGREFDLTSNLYYYRSRSYDPMIGRFLEKDIASIQMRNSQMLNRYAYVENNPVKYRDPFGLFVPVEPPPEGECPEDDPSNGPGGENGGCGSNPPPEEEPGLEPCWFPLPFVGTPVIKTTIKIIKALGAGIIGGIGEIIGEVIGF